MNAAIVESFLDEFMQLSHDAQRTEIQRHLSTKPGKTFQQVNLAVGALAEGPNPVIQLRKQLNVSSSGDAENCLNKAESSEGLGFKTKLSL